MQNETIFFLMLGTFAMFFPILFLCKQYHISRWNSILITPVLTVVGTLGTCLLFYMENRQFGGTSFFGAVFFVPVVFMVVAPLFRIPYGKLMDMCAVGECMMLAVMRIGCYRSDCCRGRVLFYLKDNSPVVFPNQIAEMIVGIVLLVVLVLWSRREEKQGKLYIWYMILYGGIRFVLNFFRVDWVDWTGGMIPFGNIWSFIALIIGLSALFVTKRLNAKK